MCLCLEGRNRLDLGRSIDVDLDLPIGFRVGRDGRECRYASNLLPPHIRRRGSRGRGLCQPKRLSFLCRFHLGFTFRDGLGGGGRSKHDPLLEFHIATFDVFQRFRLARDTESINFVCFFFSILSQSKVEEGKEETHLPSLSKQAANSSYTNTCSVPISFLTKNQRTTSGLST